MNSAKFLTAVFQNTSGQPAEQLLLNFTKENKASENKISKQWFYYPKFHIQIILHSNKYQKA